MIFIQFSIHIFSYSAGNYALSIARHKQKIHYFCHIINHFTRLAMTVDPKFHSFARPVTVDQLPPRFTYPFCYTPHPLCIEAAALLRDYILSHHRGDDVIAELDEGKMLGVLVVQDADDRIGFLAAFSGNLCHSCNHHYFVPAVYDLLDPEGEFRQGENAISLINKRISALQNDGRRALLAHRVEEEKARLTAEIERFSQAMKQEKKERHMLRAEGNLSPEVEADMIARSQFAKAELKRRRRAAQEAIDALPELAELRSLDLEMAQLSAQRKSMSAQLQNRLFQLFVMRNARGETADLANIFSHTTQGIPPAGAGECAAPRLLQYAFTHGFKPRAMAEFWWGKSPAAEVRHHGEFYPACRSKCLPILTFMMQGLSVDPNPHEAESVPSSLTLLYDDAYLSVVDKPAGMLTVPGRIDATSLLSLYQNMFPEASGPMIVHRLDMATSGIVLIAKTKDVHKHLQSQFADRRTAKIYEALLEGIVTADEGIISLPIRPNPDDRPRQIVDCVNGKEAITHYRVIDRTATGCTRIEFHPMTGRTHQLRLHSAHQQGLGCPIVGDTLYGKHSDGTRLCLHARSLTFTHPVTGKVITITSPTPF